MLYWLAVSPEPNAKVGIETYDDVVVETENSVILEQDKCSTTGDGYLLSDRSNNLWKTLLIWVNSIKNNEVDLNRTAFYIIKNKERSECLAKRMGKANKTEEDIRNCIKDLKDEGEKINKRIQIKEGRKASTDLENYVKEVIECDNQLLGGFISKIRYLDGSIANEHNSRAAIANELHLPENSVRDEVIESLLGWIFSKITVLWNDGRPAWITQTEFNDRFWHIRSSIKDRAFKETAINDLMPVSEEDRQARLGEMFVRQIEILNLEEDEDTIIDAIDCYLHCSCERIRYSQEGWVTKDQFRDFDTNLKRRWENISRRLKCNPLIEKENHEEKIGQQIRYDTINHNETLAGQQTQRYYLIEGTYHMLANELLVGWHPRYGTLLRKQRLK